MFGGNALGAEKLRIGELAQIANVTKRTIDYYTNLGLLEVERSASNYRYYDHSSIERLRFIEAKKNEGMSLEEIKRKLQETESEKMDVFALRDKLKRIEKEISHLLFQIEKADVKNWESLKKKISPENLTIIQTLLFILH